MYTTYHFAGDAQLITVPVPGRFLSDDHRVNLFRDATNVLCPDGARRNVKSQRSSGASGLTRTNRIDTF